MTLGHPHELRRAIPSLVPPSEVRRLSAIEPRRALRAIAEEWAVILSTVAFAVWADAWAVSLAAIALIGARQHALLVIAHDASHFRLLAHRTLNDGVGNVFLAWPMFVSVEGFRHFHGDHHRYLQQEGDGNRVLWGTHDAGELVPEWRYPKSRAGIAVKVLRRAAFLTGLYWMARGLLGGFMFGAPRRAQVMRVGLAVAVAAGLTAVSGWKEFALYWVVPYCTWHVAAQYLRLICEHSAVSSADPRFADTRSTIPGWVGRLLVLPRNIGYHQAHHWFPSVPFYHLPELHARLEEHPDFREHARVSRSIAASLREVAS